MLRTTIRWLISSNKRLIKRLENKTINIEWSYHPIKEAL
jgi:hypothetical protein